MDCAIFLKVFPTIGCFFLGLLQPIHPRDIHLASIFFSGICAELASIGGRNPARRVKTPSQCRKEVPWKVESWRVSWCGRGAPFHLKPMEMEFQMYHFFEFTSKVHLLDIKKPRLQGDLEDEKEAKCEELSYQHGENSETFAAWCFGVQVTWTRLQQSK